MAIVFKRVLARVDSGDMGPALSAGANIGIAVEPRLPAPAADLPLQQESVTEALERRSRREVRFLHGRSMPLAGLRIDHIAIAPGGVWVLDARRYDDEAYVVGHGAAQQLWIGEENRTALVEALTVQVEAISAVVEEICPDVRTHGALCFTDTDLPAFRTLTVRGYPLYWAKALPKRLNADGPVDDAWGHLLVEELAAAFPSTH
jgi:hypothetical protein